MMVLVMGATGATGAADYLRVRIGQDDKAIEWVVVRPDTLVDEQVIDLEAHPSPTRSAIFNAGRTSRTGVADFMANLITDDTLWKRWKGQMPVIYNRTFSGAQPARPSSAIQSV